MTMINVRDITIRTVFIFLFLFSGARMMVWYGMGCDAMVWYATKEKEKKLMTTTLTTRKYPVLFIAIFIISLLASLSKVHCNQDSENIILEDGSSNIHSNIDGNSNGNSDINGNSNNNGGNGGGGGGGGSSNILYSLPYVCSDGKLSSSFVILTSFVKQSFIYFTNPYSCPVCIQTLRLDLSSICPEVDPFRNGLNFSSSIVSANGRTTTLLGYEGYNLKKEEAIPLVYPLCANCKLQASLDFFNVRYPSACKNKYLVSIGVLYSGCGNCGSSQGAM